MTLIDRLWRRARGLGADAKIDDANSPCRIIGLSMVKNEQDIIEPFIRHNAKLLDCMVVVDNASVDETRRIAMD